jgi:hypothetical protein
VLIIINKCSNTLCNLPSLEMGALTSYLLGESYLKLRSVSQVDPSLTHEQSDIYGGKTLGHGVHDIQGTVVSHLWVIL